jgi:hypothetical protein
MAGQGLAWSGDGKTGRGMGEASLGEAMPCAARLHTLRQELWRRSEGFPKPVKP